jgi:hypothetical protein
LRMSLIWKGLTRISDLNFSFPQNHMPATLPCQVRIAVATGLVASLASSQVDPMPDKRCQLNRSMQQKRLLLMALLLSWSYTRRS